MTTNYRTQAEELEGRIRLAIEALTFATGLLDGHRYQWEHDGDEESGQHDEDCRACEYEALLARLSEALSALRSAQAETPCRGCGKTPCGEVAHQDPDHFDTPPEARRAKILQRWGGAEQLPGSSFIVSPTPTTAEPLTCGTTHHTGCDCHEARHRDELTRLRAELEQVKKERDEVRAFLRRTAMTGGSIVSSVAMTATQIGIARSADRMLVLPDGYGFAYVPGPMFCACGRLESDCDQSRAACPNKTAQLYVTGGMTMTTHWADHACEDDEESDIIIAGRQVPFVQVGMIVHPDDCLNCEREGSPLWCSALVCDIHDDDETARFGMMATLLFRDGSRREEPCGELRRRWRLARDFDQSKVYTGRWGPIPRGSVWPVAQSEEDA